MLYEVITKSPIKRRPNWRKGLSRPHLEGGMADKFDRLKKALSSRYIIERALGRGGMATVYLAEDVKHHRKVAVKVLRPELAASLGTERFVREIRIAANLTHPHILALHDSGEADGFLFRNNFV